MASQPRGSLFFRAFRARASSLEDETGVVQVIVWKSLREKQRKVLLGSRLLAVHSTWQREGEVRSLIAGRLEDLARLLGRLADAPASRDFH